jgi:MarR family transcriptional regulator, 2-MHQ and catechol-resistance regulon repressor
VAARIVRGSFRAGVTITQSGANDYRRGAPRNRGKSRAPPASSPAPSPARRRFTEAYLNIARSQGFLGQEFERLFQQHGVSAPQYNVLRILRGHGGEGVACLAIARNMVHRMPDITRLGDRLERAGLVKRGRTKEDRRVVLLKITPAGRDLLARLDAPVRQMHKQLLGHLDAKELAELNRLLAKARRPWVDKTAQESSGGSAPQARPAKTSAPRKRAAHRAKTGKT